MLYTLCHLERTFSISARTLVLCVQLSKRKRNIVCWRGNDIIWGVGSWKFHLVRVMKQQSHKITHPVHQQIMEKIYWHFFEIVLGVKIRCRTSYAAPSSSSEEELAHVALWLITKEKESCPVMTKSGKMTKLREKAQSSSQYPKRNASPTLCSAVHAALFQAAWLTAGLACWLQW